MVTQLICKHAATAAGIAERTAYKRISKAKDSLSGEPDKGAGAEAFTILLQYAESSGSQVSVTSSADCAFQSATIIDLSGYG